MPGFARFNKVWATNGIANAPTDAQADTGFAYLGPTPPSVESFNGINQDFDEKDNWLFNQIDEVIQAGLGTPATEQPEDQLANAIRGMINAGVANLPFNNYVLKAGDVMSGFLSLNADATANLHAVPLQQLNARLGALGNYVLKSGDTMSGTLDNQAGRILSSSGGNPSLMVHVPGAYAAGFWLDTAGILYFGQGDGAGNATAAWGYFRSTLASITPPLSVGGRITGNSGVSFVADGTMAAYDDGGGNRYYTWMANWYDVMATATGMRTWFGNGGGLMSLDGGGNLWNLGNHTCNAITASTTISANTNIWAGGTISSTSTLASGADLYVTSTANVMGVIYGQGYIYANYTTFNDFFLGASTLAGSGADQTALNFAGFPASGNSSALNYARSGPTAGKFTFYRDNQPRWNMDGGGNTIQNGNCGALSYSPISDERIKKNIVPYTKGLTDILNLSPISYEMNGEGTFIADGKVRAGLSAQALQIAFPEAVVELIPADIDMENASAELHHNEIIPGMLGVDIMPIVMAMLNGMKELSARLTTLEGT